MIDGGDLDVNFFVNGPNQASLVMDPSSTDGLHAIDIKTTGEHEICLDNSYSRFTGMLNRCHIQTSVQSRASLVPRPFPPLVFDRLQYARMEGEGLGERVTCVTSGRHEGRREGGGA